MVKYEIVQDSILDFKTDAIVISVGKDFELGGHLARKVDIMYSKAYGKEDKLKDDIKKQWKKDSKGIPSIYPGSVIYISHKQHNRDHDWENSEHPTFLKHIFCVNLNEYSKSYHTLNK